MKLSRKTFVAFFVCCLIAAMSVMILGACSKQEPQLSGPSNSQLMDETMENAKKKAEEEKARKEHEAELMQPFYALILGCDGRDNTSEGEEAKEGEVKDAGRSDTMMLARVWPETGAITLVSIPRDTQVYYDGADMRLNSVYNKGGSEAVVSEVEKMAGIEIKYFFQTEFARFVQLIDALGGVDVTSPVYMWQKDAISGVWYEVPEGASHLDGKEALIFSRVRKVFGDNQDACRQMQDRQVVQSVLSTIPGMDANTLSTCIDAVYSYTDTNLPKEDMKFYANYFSSDFESLSFQSGTFPYSGALNEELDMWLVPYDEAKWKEMVAKIEEGGSPTDVVANPEVWFK